jgi:hypothetical protein
MEQRVHYRDTDVNTGALELTLQLIHVLDKLVGTLAYERVNGQCSPNKIICSPDVGSLGCNASVTVGHRAELAQVNMESVFNAVHFSVTEDDLKFIEAPTIDEPLFSCLIGFYNASGVVITHTGVITAGCSKMWVLKCFPLLMSSGMRGANLVEVVLA